jgi:2-succinyl-5-enolpyruvyl-6-hydroxy-3-cyclohexene-1-carboxylate synthase
MSGKHTSVVQAALLVQHLYDYGMRHAVVCPGSRNAPIIHALVAHGGWELTSVIDERNAGFQALGISLGLGIKPVMVVTTSGTAALNLASAMAEADLMNLPLFAISADRPKEWIGQQDNQAIVQSNIFQPFVRYSAEFLQSKNQDFSWFNAQKLAEAWIASQTPRRGPVHLNIPIAEPFYSPLEQALPLPKASKIELPIASSHNVTEAKRELLGKKILVVAGQSLDYHSEIFSAWQSLPQAFVFSERLANLPSMEGWNSEGACMDLELNAAKAPDLVIYFGGPVVSKRMKLFLKRLDVPFWTIGSGFFPKTYEKIDRYFVADVNEWMAAMLPEKENSSFNSIWMEENIVANEVETWEEQEIYRKIFPFLTADWIHWGNSGVIRYALDLPFTGKKEWGNRGASGIDGSLSTAVGTASLGESVDLVIGDISFGYNANGLWQEKGNLPLRIWVINNGGGKIFSSLEGPKRFEEALPYQETPHPFSIQKVAEAFGAEYHRVASLEEWSMFSSSFNFSKRERFQVIELVG